MRKKVHPGDLARGLSDLEVTWLLCCAGAAAVFIIPRTWLLIFHWPGISEPHFRCNIYMCASEILLLTYLQYGQIQKRHFDKTRQQFHCLTVVKNSCKNLHELLKCQQKWKRITFCVYPVWTSSQISCERQLCPPMTTNYPLPLDHKP